MFKPIDLAECMVLFGCFVSRLTLVCIYANVMCKQANKLTHNIDNQISLKRKNDLCASIQQHINLIDV